MCGVDEVSGVVGVSAGAGICGFRVRKTSILSVSKVGG